MKLNLFSLGFASLLSLSSPLWAYAYLSEFVSSDGSTLRTTTASSSDQIMNPTWGGSVNFKICTGGTGYANAGIVESTEIGASSKSAQLVADINQAIQSWKGAGSGTALTMATATANSDCGPNLGTAYGGNDGKNEIFFNNVFDNGDSVNSGVLAFTILSLEMQNGKLRIVDADILFNSNASINFLTQDYIDANSPSNSTTKFSFLGVLTHEMGHALGLAHSPVNDDNDSDGFNTYATMFQAVSSLNHSRVIESLLRDDIASIMNLYSASGSFSSATYSGSISGYVYRADGTPQRGAQVTAFATGTETSLASVMTGMAGTKSEPDGAYTIKGLPLNTEFIVFVEPVHRPNVHPNFVYNVINTPITSALSGSSEGYKTFAVEAYPDVQVADVRLTGDASSSPGLGDATRFTLSSATPAETDINFYLSTSFNSPNDAISTALAVNPDDTSDTPTIANSNPLVVKLTIPTDLSVFPNPRVSVSAVKGSSTYDWTDFVPTGDLRTTSATMTMHLPTTPSDLNGSYTVTVSLSDSKYGDFTSERNITIQDWNASPNAGIVFADGTDLDNSGNSSGGGGGCSFQSQNATSSGLPLFSLFLALGLYVSRYGRRPSPVPGDVL